MFDNFVTVNPSVSLFTMNRDWLLRGASLLPVWHKTMKKSAIGAFVMRVFVTPTVVISRCIEIDQCRYNGLKIASDFVNR